ncbi:MAG: NB-ARC domain-containing protein [Ktedonobacteraceae bacterium]
MKRFSYRERDNAFGQAMLSLRTGIGLTQAGLADLLGISRRAVGEWEAGSSYPTAQHLQHVITLAVQQQAFAAGREAEEIRALWKAAHQKVLLDEQWLSTLLGRSPSSLSLVDPLPVAPVPAQPAVPVHATSGPLVEWGDALDVPSFYGREQELATLSRWVVQERCRVVSVVGLGGIGKSALVTSAMHQLADHFQVVIFRSLRDAPSCDALVEGCLQVLASEALVQAPQSLERRLSLLLEELRTSRVLLVLDNLESLLSEGEVSGHLRPGFEGYGRLLRQVAQPAHQSCLLLTSREKPAELRALEGSRTPVRALRLAGLEAAACESLLTEHEVKSSPEELARLVQAYSGNPLALKIVAETIVDLFGGEIDQFLSGGTHIFGSIAELLEEHFARLSSLEQTVLCWLAIMREPVTLEELLAVLVAPLPRVQVLEAVDGLRRRSLIERGQRAGSFTLQSVVLEYVTSRLVTMASQEIEQGRLSLLLQHGLSQAQAKDYVRETQERLLLAPLQARLQHVYQGRADVEKQLCVLLDQVRPWSSSAQGYGPANLVALLRLLRGDLHGLDLSQLSLRRVYLQGVQMQDATLSGALMRECVFTEAFDASWAVAISRNGQYWAAGSKRGEVRVWEEEGQTLHRIWQAHTDIVPTIAFSPDGCTLASGSYDGSIKLWEVASGALLWTGWHTDSIYSVAFAPDGSLLASGGNDATVRLWDRQSGTQLQTLSHPDPVFEVTWSPDGHLLASGGLAGQIRVWEIEKTQLATCIQTLAGHTNWVVRLAFAPDGSILASGSHDGTVKLWDVASGRLLQTLAGHKDRVLSMAWSPDGRTLASGSRDHTIWLWDVEQGSTRAALQGHTAEVYNLAFTPDSRSLFSGSDDGTLRVWDVESGQCVRVMQGYAVSLYDLDWSPDGTQVVSGGTDTLVTLWDVNGRGGGTPPRVLRGHRWIVYGVEWSPDGSRLASSGWDNAIRLWDPATGTCVQVLSDSDDPTYFFEVVWSPDGERLASGTYMHGVLVWEVTAHRHRWVGREAPTLIRCVAWSPEGMRLVGGGDDGQVYVWDASDGTLLQQLAGHHGGITSVAWHPDGMRLASGGGGREGGELFVWDAQSGQRHPAWGAGNRALVGHPGVVSAVAWGPSEELLLSGGSDGLLRWWEVDSGQCVRVRKAHHGTIRSLRRSPDGSRLASCGDDGAIMLWDLQGGEHLRTLRRDRPYERLNITGIRGLTEAQKATLRALGAVEEGEGLLKG